MLGDGWAIVIAIAFVAAIVAVILAIILFVRSNRNYATEDDITNLQNQIDGLQDGIDGLQTSLNATDTDIINLNDDLATTNDNVSGLQDDVTALQDDIDELSQDISMYRTFEASTTKTPGFPSTGPNPASIDGVDFNILQYEAGGIIYNNGRFIVPVDGWYDIRYDIGLIGNADGSAGQSIRRSVGNIVDDTTKYGNNVHTESSTNGPGATTMQTSALIQLFAGDSVRAIFGLLPTSRQISQDLTRFTIKWIKPLT